MTFDYCAQMWGSARIISERPNARSFRDVIYSPFKAGDLFNQNTQWGVFEKDRSIVMDAAYIRGSERKLISQSSKLRDVENSDLMYAPEDTYFYGGILIPHFGHFLITSLSRLWAFREYLETDIKIVFHSDHEPDEYFKFPYIRDLLTVCGISPSRAIRFRHPVLIKNLIVPTPAFIEQNCAHTVFAEFCHDLGEILSQNELEPMNRTPVYLSKTQLNIGVARIVNEKEVEDSLKSRGFDVVYPEQLSLAEQIGLFKTRTKIAGSIGSGFHTHIFMKEPPRMLCISASNVVNSNFIILDKLNKAHTEYVTQKDNFRDAKDERFLKGFLVENTAALVDDLISWAGLGPVRGKTMQLEADQKKEIARTEGARASFANCMPDLTGADYAQVLSFIHKQCRPRTYLEIGTLNGNTFRLANCASIAIDPSFSVQQDIINGKPLCACYQMPSDQYFAQHNPRDIFGQEIDFAFIDGMHLCEWVLRDFANTEAHCHHNSIIAIHDCVPVELPMADRDRGTIAVMPHRSGWWTGDVWRTVLALKQFRPDLSISLFDAPPTGLAIVSNLDPASRLIFERYDEIVAEMQKLNLADMTLSHYYDAIELQSTSVLTASTSDTTQFQRWDLAFKS